jgi:hypothetical protein
MSIPYQRAATSTTNPNNHLPNAHHNDSPHDDQIMQEHGSMHNNDIYRYTYSVPDLDELHLIIRQMRSNVALGPNGMNAAFYKSAWSWLK